MTESIERARQVALHVGLGIAFSLVAACMVLVLIGPENTDRAVAFDLAIVLSAVALGIFAAASGVAAYMDTALMLAILSFLVTLILARVLTEAGRR